MADNDLVDPYAPSDPMDYPAEMARLRAANRDLVAALKIIAGGHIDGGGNLILAGRWNEFVAKLQEIARSALAKAGA